MPELPEVENTVRSLKRLIIGSRIKRVWTDTPSLIRCGSLQNLQQIIQDKKSLTFREELKILSLFWKKSALF